MSTKKTQTDTLAFDPQSLGRYQGAQDTSLQGFTDFATDPMKAGYFNQILGLLTGQANTQAGAGMQNLLLNLPQVAQRGQNLGLFQSSQLAQQGRQGSAIQTTALQNALAQALNFQQNALGALQGFRPLQTGSTSVQQTGGLGTWLPQVIGAGIGAATGFGGGAGLMGMFGGGRGFTPSGGFSIPGGFGFGGAPSAGVSGGIVPGQLSGNPFAPGNLSYLPR